MSESDLSTEELLARLRDGGAPLAPTLVGVASAQAWIQEFHVIPGFVNAVTGSVLVKHYREWCAEQGHQGMNHTQFLVYLRKNLGLTRGRDQTSRRDRRPYRMRADAAEYFREWEKRHFTRADNLPSTMKSNAEKAMEELGVKP